MYEWRYLHRYCPPGSNPHQSPPADHFGSLKRWKLTLLKLTYPPPSITPPFSSAKIRSASPTSYQCSSEKTTITSCTKNPQRSIPAAPRGPPLLDTESPSSWRGQAVLEFSAAHVNTVSRIGKAQEKEAMKEGSNCRLRGQYC